MDVEGGTQPFFCRTLRAGRANLSRPFQGLASIAAKMTDSTEDAGEDPGPGAAATPQDAAARLAEAAAGLFAAHGYEHVSIDRIAAAIGATKGLFYHHYTAKADVLADIVVAARAAALNAAEAALAALPAEESADRRLEALAQGELRAAFERPDASRIAARADDILATARLSETHAAKRDRARDLRQALEQLYLDAYRAGVRSGRLEPLPPRFAIWLIRLPILAAADWSGGPDGGRTPADRVADAVARFAARGLVEPPDVP